MTYTSVAHCGNDHSAWLKSLDFYKDDLKVLEKRLGEIISKNNGHETMAQAEHFQNQFLIQQNNIDELKHKVHQHDEQASGQVQSHAGKIETGTADNHKEIKEEYESFEKVIHDVRHTFNEFASKWM